MPDDDGGDGNPNQWVDGHPRLSLIEDDIKAQISYVCVIDGRIEAALVPQEGDSDYDRIYQGQWQNDDPYVAIHRLASAAGGRFGRGDF